jgi:flagellar biosynthesis anti-sigma factor FlgM
MKIDGNNPYIRPEFQAQQKEQLSQQEQQQKAQAEKSSGDRLEFSVTGKELQYLSQKAVEAPEIRAERVAEIKSRVDAGTYNIKAQEIAEAIITGSLIDKSA